MAKLHSIGLDWITVTARSENEAFPLSLVWLDVYAYEASCGGISAEVIRLGYAGNQINGSFFGKRDDGYLLMLSGDSAQMFGWQLLKFNCKITRLDVQVTVELDEYDAHYASRETNNAFENRSAMPNRNWGKIKYLNTFGEGDTVSVGSRQSERYGRLYDKEKEQDNGSYLRCWRYEIEYKGDAAHGAANHLLLHGGGSGAMLDLVASQWSDWGFRVPVLHNDALLTIERSSHKSDTDKTLNWLAIQVAPSVRKLRMANISQERIIDILFGLCEDREVNSM